MKEVLDINRIQFRFAFIADTDEEDEYKDAPVKGKKGKGREDPSRGGGTAKGEGGQTVQAAG